MKKLLLTLFLLLSAIGWAYAVEEELAYTIDFCGTTYGNALTEEKFKSCLNSGSEYISSVTTTNCFADGADKGYRISSSNTKTGAGSFTLTLSEAGQVNATSIKVYTAAYSSSTKTDTPDFTLQANTSTDKLSFTSSSENLVQTLSLSGESLTTITGTGTGGKRIYLQKIEVYKGKEVVVNDVVFTYNNATCSGEVSAKAGEVIEFSSEGATKLNVNGNDVEGSSSTFTVPEEETTLTVIPYINDKAGNTATLKITIKAADALDNPTFSIAGDAYDLGTQITITSKVGLAYKIGNAEEIDLDGDKSGASATIALTKDYIEDGLTITAYSYSTDGNDLKISDEVTQTYTIIRPAAPQFVTESGAIANGSDVIISAGEDAAKIGYQINDSEERFAPLDDNHQASISVSKDDADSEGYVRITALAYNAAGAWSKENVTATFEPTDVVTYTLVTDVNQIKAGVKFLLAYAKSNVAASSFNSGSYYDRVKATFTNDNTTLEVLPTDTYNVFTVVKENDKLYIKDSDGKYLKTGITQSESASSEATFENDTTYGIVLKLGSSYVCYNTSSPRFKTYSSMSSSLPGAQIFRSTDDFSAIADAELAVEKVTLDRDNCVELTEGEGWTEKYPAYYTEVNQLTLTYNIESDTDAEATYDVTVTAGEETIKVADAKAGENTVVVPWAATYTVKLNKVIFSDDKGEQELNSEAELTNAITLNEEISATRTGKVLYDTDLIIDWTINGIAATDTYAAYITYYFTSSSEDEIGVATEGYTEYGLEGYQAYNGSEFTEANNWSSIAAKEGHLPMHFAGMKVGESVMGTITVVYPFLYNGKLDIESHKAKADVEDTVNNDDIATGVNSVLMNANGEAEYYNLQGVRVYSPANGLYIRKQGNTVSKVRL
jgi:hypothetical protein